jgi:hypothetical protein
LETYFVSYTGGRPSNKVLLNYVKLGWSPYSLTVSLAKSKQFTNSPIYKRSAPALQEAAKSVLGQGQKLDIGLLRSAIVNGWSGSELQAVLRTKPNYTSSNEFKQNTATLLNVHQSIMGTPDAGGMNTIQQAAAAGWDANQYAAWLRAQPQYVQSPEYQTKSLNFLSSIGLITGEQPVLKKGKETEPNPNPGMGKLPTDKRLPAGKLTNPEDTFATYG